MNSTTPTPPAGFALLTDQDEPIDEDDLIWGISAQKWRPQDELTPALPGNPQVAHATYVARRQQFDSNGERLAPLPCDYRRVTDPGAYLQDGDLIWNYVTRAWQSKEAFGFGDKVAVENRNVARKPIKPVTPKMKMEYDADGDPLASLPPGYVRLTDPRVLLKDDDLIWDYLAACWREKTSFISSAFQRDPYVSTRNVGRKRGKVQTTAATPHHGYGHW